MDPHPDFGSSALPRETRVGDFLLGPLGPAEAEEDFAVVTASEAVLVGVFQSRWPIGLTLEENRIDMGWHDREFTARRSFAWIVRDPEGAYLGCAYLYPDIGATGRGHVVTWIRDMPDRLAVLERFNAQFWDWLAPYLPEGYEVRLTSNDR
ncbi:MAG: hypothetical protein AAGF79_03860 [Pseudomonadota bacterium]